MFAAAGLGVMPTAPAHAGELSVAGSAIRFVVDGEAPAPVIAMIGPWIKKCAEAVRIYYGRFPVPEVSIVIVPAEGAGIGGGRTFPGDVPRIVIRIGRATSERQFMTDDWVMVHEMVHLAFPWLNRRHNWMAEGLAVYVESIARVQAGHLAPARIWNDFMRDMPKGLPQPGDRGLDFTPSWGRTYWGGAMFCLLADIRIREETGSRFGLQHALRTINRTRDFRREWDFLETLALGDAATGRQVLVTQYADMKDRPLAPDLEALWQRLGVERSGEAVILNEAAPLAAMRLAIETPPV